jgi:hypothetical protein
VNEILFRPTQPGARLDCPLGGLPQEVFDRNGLKVPASAAWWKSPRRVGKDLFDRVEIGAIGREKEEPCANRPDRGADGLAFVAAERSWLEAPTGRPLEKPAESCRG